MRRFASHAKRTAAVIAKLDPDRAALTGAMLDPVRLAAQRNNGAVPKWRRRGQPLEPGGDPGAVLLREGAGVLDTAARRHGEHDFAGRRLHAQRITARLAVALQPHLIDRAVESNLEGARPPRALIKQGAKRHEAGARWLLAS